jgi:hypothetical protein
MYGVSVHSDMIIRSVRHRGLLRLIEDDDSRELRSDLVRRLRNILAVLIAAADMSGVSGQNTQDVETGAISRLFGEEEGIASVVR